MKHEGMGSRERALLERYGFLLRERAIPIGAISSRDRDRLWERHILDSLRGADLVDPDDRDAIDLGSGAGLPGLVIAVVRPALRVRLVEPRAKRAAFLELAIEALGVTNATVVVERAEDLREPADLCFARAFGDPAASWRAADPLLKPGGRLIYFAGGRFDASRDVPEEVATHVVAERPLERLGPLVIMTRQ